MPSSRLRPLKAVYRPLHTRGSLQTADAYSEESVVALPRERGLQLVVEDVVVVVHQRDPVEVAVLERMDEAGGVLARQPVVAFRRRGPEGT